MSHPKCLRLLFQNLSGFWWLWRLLWIPVAGAGWALVAFDLPCNCEPWKEPLSERIFVFAVTKHDVCLLQKDRSCAALSQPAENNISPDNPPLYSPIWLIRTRIKSCWSCLYQQMFSMLAGTLQGVGTAIARGTSPSEMIPNIQLRD